MLNSRQKKQIQMQLKAHQHQTYFTDIKIEEIILKDFVIYQNVFRPDVMASSKILAKFLVKNKSLYENKTVLDMGCGSGIQGILIGLNGAKTVVFSDISSDAVDNTTKNIENFGLNNKTTVLQGDLFEKVKQKFDVIIFNHPFFAAYPFHGVVVSKTMLDPGIIINLFLEEAKDYLNPYGLIVMPFFHLAGETNNPKIQGPGYGYKIIEISLENTQIGLQKGKFSVFILRPDKWRI